MQQFEEDRAWAVFETELRATRDPRAALRAALVDFESRLLPKERQRVAEAPIARPLLERYRALVEAVCEEVGAKVDVVCSFDRAGSAEVVARGVLVGVFTDAGARTRRISDGIGMSNSVVNNLKLLRRRRPDWEPLIARFAPMVRKPRKPGPTERTASEISARPAAEESGAHPNT